MPGHRTRSRSPSAAARDQERPASSRAFSAPASAAGTGPAFNFAATPVSAPPRSPDRSRRSASEPADPERLRQARLRGAPQSAQPQMTFADLHARQVSSFNVPLDSSHHAPVQYRTPDTRYQAEYRRNPEEQRVASMPFNVMAPLSREPFHGSHSGQHGTAGDASRVNMTPISATGNVRTIGHGFEQPQRALRTDLSGQQLSGGTAGFSHQLVDTRYDPGAMRPRLASDATLSALRAGSPLENSMARSIETQATVVPSWQRRDMYTPGLGHATQVLGPAEVMGPRGGSAAAPRYALSHLQRPQTRHNFERAGQPTGSPLQYGTSENPHQQRSNALFHADLMRHLPPDHLHRQRYRAEMAAAAAGQRMFSWEVLERAQAATQQMPNFSTGRNAAQQGARLAAEANEFIYRGRPMGAAGDRYGRRRDRSPRAPDLDAGEERRDHRPRHRLDRDDRGRSPRRVSRSRSRSRSRARARSRSP